MKPKTKSQANEFELTLISSETEVCILRLTKAEFKECAKNGMSYEKYEELDGSAEVSGPTSDGPIQLEIDGKKVPRSDALLLKLYKKAKAEALKQDRQSMLPTDQYAAIMDKLSNDSWRFIRIHECFDPKKLSMTVSFDKCLGLDSHVVETFELTYDGISRPFEFLKSICQLVMHNQLEFSRRIGIRHAQRAAVKFNAWLCSELIELEA